MTDYRYILTAPHVQWAPELSGVTFDNEWLTIRNGVVTIQAGYAWDGCSPARRLPGGIWIGTPDGPLAENGRPVSYLPSLVHDALCQFRLDIPGLRKSATVALFRRMLQECGAPWWMVQLYPRAVERFGPQNWNGGD